MGGFVKEMRFLYLVERVVLFIVEEVWGGDEGFFVGWGGVFKYGRFYVSFVWDLGESFGFLYF